MNPPLQVLASPLAAPPEAVWPRLQHSAFLASYLGACLPEACWTPGLTLHGSRADGSCLQLTLQAAHRPAQMLFVCRDDAGQSQLQLTIEPRGQGSRLTVLQGPSSLPPVAGPTAQGPAAHGLADQLATAPNAAWLSGRPGSFDDPSLRQQALSYLADTARLVAGLRLQMADHQGYARPAMPGFSLVQHLWHLADVEQFGWAIRFQRLRREVAPVLPGVDGDRLAEERQYQQRPWRAAARRFEAQRRRTLQALALCDAAVLRRPAQFSGQPSSGTEMLAALLAHDHEHRLEMAALWPPGPGRAEAGPRPRGRPIPALTPESP